MVLRVLSLSPAMRIAQWVAPRRLTIRRRIVPLLVLLFLAFYFLDFWALGYVPYPGITKLSDVSGGEIKQPLDSHPISQLIANATEHFEKLLAKRSYTLRDAAARYRERRGRHPPPGFEVWFEQATKDQAIIVEEFFDRIDHDITPLWALSPREMRMQATSQPQVIRVRGGRVKMVTDDATRQPWIQHWTALVKQMMPNLPDLDMAVNVMDETRILTPWETIRGYVRKERELRRGALFAPAQALSEYGSLRTLDRETETMAHATGAAYDPGWTQTDAAAYWDYYRATCPPDSPGRNVSALASFSAPIEYPNVTTMTAMPYTHGGFVQNFTGAQDPCLQPHLRGLHGTFVESFSVSSTPRLFPLFGGSKLRGNNELLIPGGMYFSTRAFYSGGRASGGPWAGKADRLVWRGTASGGRNRADNWWHFHRHRWVQMMNGTTVSAVERGEASRGPAFAPLLPDASSDAFLPRQIQGDVGGWVSGMADVSFVNLECFPAVPKPHEKTCAYTGSLLGVAKAMPMKRQYGYKYLADVDGNSYSARWRAFLKSTSVPLKATIYTEWHDDRMVPWVHFVPFDASYRDIYGVMHYFLDGRDAVAEVIARESRNWANAVYRNEDMKLYVWRLLLEYARVVDDNRDRLAFVGDLTEGSEAG